MVSFLADCISIAETTRGLKRAACEKLHGTSRPNIALRTSA
jgi:hypothetical protein